MATWFQTTAALHHAGKFGELEDAEAVDLGMHPPARPAAAVIDIEIDEIEPGQVLAHRVEPLIERAVGGIVAVVRQVGFIQPTPADGVEVGDVPAEILRFLVVFVGIDVNAGQHVEIVAAAHDEIQFVAPALAAADVAGVVRVRAVVAFAD